MEYKLTIVIVLCRVARVVAPKKAALKEAEAELINEGDWIAMEVGSETRYAQTYVVEKEYFTAIPAYTGSSDATGVVIFSGSYSE